MKKIFILFLLLSFCSGSTEKQNQTTAVEESSNTTSTTTSSSTTTSTTIPLFQKIYASELQVGDCFNNNGNVAILAMMYLHRCK